VEGCLRSSPAEFQNWLINIYLQAEQKSVAELQALLARTIEGVSFFLLLIDHRIGELIGQYVLSLIVTHCMTKELDRTDATTQRLIASMTFEELITGQNGVTASRAVVNVIIDQQIGQQIAVCNMAQLGALKFTLWTHQVDTISDILQTRCGSFCSTDDVMLYKVRMLCTPLAMSYPFLRRLRKAYEEPWRVVIRRSDKATSANH
jgi:nuclear pore complex protein Nup155